MTQHKISCSTVAARAATFCLVLALVAPFQLAEAHSPKAHRHGASEIEVTIEGARVQIRLQSPMEDLVGFERKPRNDRERELIKVMGDQLGSGTRLFGLPAAAGCAQKSHDWSAPVLEQKYAAKDDDHADVKANWVLECASPKAIKSLTVNLFDVFARVKTVSVQLVAADAQRGGNLTSGKRQLNW